MRSNGLGCYHRRLGGLDLCHIGLGFIPWIFCWRGRLSEEQCASFVQIEGLCLFCFRLEF